MDDELNLSLEEDDELILEDENGSASNSQLVYIDIRSRMGASGFKRKRSRTISSISQRRAASSRIPHIYKIVINISEPIVGSSCVSEPIVGSSCISEPIAASSRIPLPCIYKVHRHLRNVNPDAYEPEVIAIGPYHHDKAHLKMMEDHKLRYRESLFKRKEGCKEEMYANVGKLESEARKCYANKSFELAFQLDESKFIEMLVLDGCFIVELVLKFDNKDDDLLFQMGWIISSLQRDLMRFENQLPFFVLCEVFDVIEGKRGQERELMRLLYNFFSDLYLGKSCPQISPDFGPQEEIMHLLDLIYRSWFPPSDSNELRGRQKVIQFISSATALTDANVKFKMEEKDSLFDVGFTDGVMVMAPLHIEDQTECLLRNLIAYEQYFCLFLDNFVTNYVRLLDCLINSAKDVELLKQEKIITNYRGDDEVVAKMVNTLRDSVTDRGICLSYAQIFKRVNEHCKKPWNKTMAMLWQKYLHNTWAIISIVVGAVLLVLSVTQTVFTILQVVGPK